MPRPDPYETAIMKQCQRGDALPHGGYTGSVCRKPLLCREEGRCYFVAQEQRYRERHPGEVLPPVRRMPPSPASPPPVWLTACCEADEQGFCAPDCPRHRTPAPRVARIVWHPGYDGYRWAV